MSDRSSDFVSDVESDIVSALSKFLTLGLGKGFIYFFFFLRLSRLILKIYPPFFVGTISF